MIKWKVYKISEKDNKRIAAIAAREEALEKIKEQTKLLSPTKK